MLAARASKKYVTQNELEEARDKVRWGRERRTLAMTDEDKKRTAWHEAGHAIISVLLEHTHPLHKVTIIPRGQSLGSTMSLPKEDVFNRHKKELLDELCVLMAGRIAEEMFSGDISTGASGDIQMATRTARAMITQYGMSEKLGMVQYGDGQEYVFLGRDVARGSEFSESTAQAIDNEVRQVIADAYTKATQLLNENKDKVEAVADSLLEYETLTGEQVAEIVETGQLTPPPSSDDSGPMLGAEASTPLPEVPKKDPPEIDTGLGSPAPAPV